MKLKLNNKILLVILIFSGIIQTILIVKPNDDVVPVVSEVQDAYFDNINSLLDEVKIIENIEIIEINNLDEKGITLKLNGDYNNINKTLNNLSKYKSDNYSIQYNNGIYEILIRLFIE